VFEHPFDAVGEGVIFPGHIPQLVPNRQVVAVIGFQPQAICLLAIVRNADGPNLHFSLLPAHTPPSSEGRTWWMNARSRLARC
jgi:hypothetical protein